MAFDSDVLRERLQALTASATPKRWLVGYSGGIDSTVLLHALTGISAEVPIVAIHIDHGLHPDSNAWSVAAGRFAEALGIEFVSVAVDTGAFAQHGPEAAAREARYQAFAGIMQDGDWLLSAHHENDQAETLILNLMRGSGPAGLAGIGAKQAFARGVLVRPMLGIPGDAIAAYADLHQLKWTEDPSNDDLHLDRNFVRREIMPVLASRWPAVANRLRQSSELLGEANELLGELADIDIADCGEAQSLSVSKMSELSEARQRNVLRRAIRQCGLPSAPATRLFQAIHELIPAREDAQPLISWPGAELRRYRDRLFVLASLDDEPSNPEKLLVSGEQPIELGDRLGRLQLVDSEGSGVERNVASQGLSIRFRSGGEALRIAPAGATRTLKNLLQEAGVLPWMRDRVPLLYLQDDLVAVADLWISADYQASDGVTIDWLEKPRLN